MLVSLFHHIKNSYVSFKISKNDNDLTNFQGHKCSCQNMKPYFVRKRKVLIYLYLKSSLDMYSKNIQKNKRFFLVYIV